ncbi:11688_t:CDS:1 [Gigaspora margarita]|uniref:11688_t:CDS:1 n=1 Tax=Gigaspora margarita TaxID=4874 RepID=A0ABN7UWN2_GIGMA|nr:11688_t:CDS:1 [Gigaspora margarita]
MYTVNPRKELYYLQLLLNNVKVAILFTDLKIVNNHLCETFKESTIRRKLIENDSMYNETMQEATQFQMPSALWKLFAMILLFGEPINTRTLWNENFVAMSENFIKKEIPNNYLQTNAVLLEITQILKQHHKSLNNFDLLLLPSTIDNFNELPRLLINELNIPVTSEDLAKIEMLNEDQKLVFDVVMKYIEKNQSATIFVDGPAGTI